MCACSEESRSVLLYKTKARKMGKKPKEILRPTAAQHHPQLPKQVRSESYRIAAEVLLEPVCAA